MEIEEALGDLIGRRCFSAITGTGTEFAFALHLGEKQRRALRLANQRLSFLQRTYEGSHTLVVECTWRVDGREGVMASCFDPAKPAGLRDAAIEDLVERTVEAVHVVRPGCDLELVFEGGRTLRCFATEVDEKSKRNNWTYSSPLATITIGPRSRIVLETPAERMAVLQRLAAAPFAEDDD